MSNYTSGPWSVPHFARPDVNCECEYVLCDHLMGAVATVHCSGEGADWKSHGDNPKFLQAIANAHLIAAAPDLLDALNGLIDFIEIDGLQMDALALSIAKAAVKKATDISVPEYEHGGAA
jgi:hypothetical protein